MVYIEFFEENVLKNLCSSLIEPPEVLYLLGDRNASEKRMIEHAERYTRFFRSRGLETSVTVRAVDRGNLFQIVKALGQIIESAPEGECAIDLTGGDELCLAAAGIIYGRYESNPRNVQLHRVNVRTGTIVNCSANENTVSQPEKGKLTIVELIALCGGETVQIGHLLGQVSASEKAGIESIWIVSKADPAGWNTFASIFAKICAERNLHALELTKEGLFAYCGRNVSRADLVRNVLRKLGETDVADVDIRTDGSLSVSVPESDCCDVVERCLTDPGSVLELKTFIELSALKENDGRWTFTDGAQSVTFALNGSTETKTLSRMTKNEIDVVMMRGMCPYFISCKNGEFDSAELNRFYSAISGFGGDYAKKILVYSGEISKLDPALRNRADYLGIRIVSSLALGTRQLRRLMNV